MATNVYGNGTNSTAGANTITHYYDRAGIKAANEMNIYGQFADRKSMPLKMGKTYKISKFLHIADRDETDPEFASKGYMSSRDIQNVTSGMPSLAEGAGAVNKQSIKKVTFTTEFARYGEMIDYTDDVEMFSEDSIQVRYREELGRLANRRMEDLMQIDMLATTNVMYSGAATSNGTLGTGLAADGSGDAAYKVSYDLIKKSLKKLVRNRAKKNTSMVTGSTKIDTKTVEKAYYAVVGPEIAYDLDNLTRGVSGAADELAFIPAHKYGAASTLVDGEIGAMKGVRFIESETAMVYAGQGAVPPQNYTGNLSISGETDLASATESDRGNFDVFPILFPTEGSFATVGLKGHGKIKFNSRSPQDIDSVNVYGNQGFFSYNFWYAGIILKEETLLKVNVLASA